jgi:tetratricopeptide (TPR) repeat protein
MKTTFSFIISVLTGFVVIAQPVTQEDRTKANEYFIAADWPKVVSAYQAIAKHEPQNVTARMRTGIGLLNLTKTQEAIKQLEEASSLGKNPMCFFYLATAYAQAKQSDKCVAALDNAIKNGFSALTLFENDPNLTKIKSIPAIEEIHQRLLKSVYPCRYSEQARQFDFWIGEWDVKSTTGQQAGTSSIQLMLGECVIYENWTSAPPQNYAGKSFNLVNAATGKWMQTWVDDKGAVIEFIDGEYKDNKLVFVTKPDSQNQITRLTFFNIEPNLVRQLFEVTIDDGKSWKTTTDLYYHRISK